MYKLTVVSGPNRGTSFPVQQGEITIGRQAGNSVVLQNSKVSKLHCLLVVNNETVEVRDKGSSNGTFVNGVLLRNSRSIQPGDRISVGDFVLELTRPMANAAVADVFIPSNNVVRFPGVSPAAILGAPGGGADLDSPSSEGVFAGPPSDPFKKFLWHFERQVMPVFYQLNLKHEWRTIAAGAIVVFGLLCVVVSIYPVTELAQDRISREATKRAHLMAKEIAEANTPFLAQRAENQTRINSAYESERSVRLAVLTDLDGRIIAPSNLQNQFLSAGSVANFASRVRDKYRDGANFDSVARTVGASTVAAVYPVLVSSNQAGRNVAVAVAVVALDLSMSTMSMGEIGVAYSKALVVLSILGFLVAYFLYRMTLRPFQVLNEDMDKVLKGAMDQVTREYKFSEMNQLWDVIASALERASKSSGPASGVENTGAQVDISTTLQSVATFFGNTLSCGVAICGEDQRISYVSPAFEEISGIRASGAEGQQFEEVARDVAFSALMTSLFERAPSSTDGVEDDFEFSGVAYRVHALAFGMSAFAGPKVYMINIRKTGEGG